MLGKEYLQKAYNQSIIAFNNCPIHHLSLKKQVIVYKEDFPQQKLFYLSPLLHTKVVTGLQGKNSDLLFTSLEEIILSNTNNTFVQKRRLMLYLYDLIFSTKDLKFSSHTSLIFDYANGIYNLQLLYDNLIECYKHLAPDTTAEVTNFSVCIINYVQIHLKESISLQSLADEMGYSYAYMGQYFKNTIGMNFVDYLQKERISKACYLLTTTNMDLTQIGTEVGFNTPNTFFKNFKKHTSMTPGEYRKLHHHNVSKYN